MRGWFVIWSNCHVSFHCSRSAPFWQAFSLRREASFPKGRSLLYSQPGLGYIKRLVKQDRAQLVRVVAVNDVLADELVDLGQLFIVLQKVKMTIKDFHIAAEGGACLGLLGADSQGF
jgi:hypothetical protein